MNDSEVIRLLTEMRDTMRRTLEIQEAMGQRQKRILRIYLTVVICAGAIVALLLPLLGYLMIRLSYLMVPFNK